MENIIGTFHSAPNLPHRIRFTSPHAEQVAPGAFVYYEQEIYGETRQVICRVVGQEPNSQSAPDDGEPGLYQAVVVGCYDGEGRIPVGAFQLPPRSTPIGRPPAGLLTDVLFKTRPDMSGAATIGTLVNREDVPVTLDANALITRHAAILGSDTADTGSLLETLITALVSENNRASVVVIDPSREITLDRMFRLSIQMHDDAPQAHVVAPGNFTSCYEELAMLDLFQLLRPMTDETDSNLHRAYEQVRQSKHGEWGLEDLLTALEEIGEAALAQQLRAKLGEPRLFHEVRETPLTRICQPGQCSVLHLDGSTPAEQRLAATVLLRRMRLVDWRHPVFVFINEAHRFAPAGSSPTSKQTMAEMMRSRQGRIGVSLVSARPDLLDGDLLSRAETVLLAQINGTDDCEHVARNAHMLSQEMLDMMPGLGGGQGIVAGLAVNTPVIVDTPGIDQSAAVTIGSIDTMPQFYTESNLSPPIVHYTSHTELILDVVKRRAMVIQHDRSDPSSLPTDIDAHLSMDIRGYPVSTNSLRHYLERGWGQRLLQIICDGCQVEWEEITTMTRTARKAKRLLADVFRSNVWEPYWMCWDAESWYAEVDIEEIGITADASFAELEALVERDLAEARDMDCALMESDVYDYLLRLRDEL